MKKYSGILMLTFLLSCGSEPAGTEEQSSSSSQEEPQLVSMADSLVFLEGTWYLCFKEEGIYRSVGPYMQDYYGLKLSFPDEYGIHLEYSTLLGQGKAQSSDSFNLISGNSYEFFFDDGVTQLAFHDSWLGDTIDILKPAGDSFLKRSFDESLNANGIDSEYFFYRESDEVKPTYLHPQEVVFADHAEGVDRQFAQWVTDGITDEELTSENIKELLSGRNGIQLPPAEVDSEVGYLRLDGGALILWVSGFDAGVGGVDFYNVGFDSEYALIGHVGFGCYSCSWEANGANTVELTISELGFNENQTEQIMIERKESFHVNKRGELLKDQF